MSESEARGLYPTIAAIVGAVTVSITTVLCSRAVVVVVEFIVAGGREDKNS